MDILPAGCSTAKKGPILSDNRHRFVNEPKQFGAIGEIHFYSQHAVITS